MRSRPAKDSTFIACLEGFMKALEIRAGRTARMAVSCFQPGDSLSESFRQWWQVTGEKASSVHIEPITGEEVLELFSSSYLGDLPRGTRSVRADFEWQFEEYIGLISTELGGEAGAFDPLRSCPLHRASVGSHPKVTCILVSLPETTVVLCHEERA